ncbi:MAG: EamA family transporter [Salinivirgaceae bacterium]|nr:MAG: EamA family transporter [Salinivirgaceae bacterium]
MNKRLLAHAALIGANLIYGVNYSIAKWIMPTYVDPFGLVVMRAIGGVLLFWLFALTVKSEKVARKDMLRLALSGMFGVALNQMMFLAGLNYTTPIDASIIMTLNPIVVLIAALILLGEKITWRKILGIILGGAGAVILILSAGKISFESDHFVGNLLMLGNTSSYAIYLVIVKPLMKKYHPITVIKWVFLYGSLIIIPAGFNEFSTTAFETFTTDVWLSVGYVVIFTTFLAYLLNIVALNWVSPTLASTYIYSQPVIAGFVAIIMLQDEITWIKVISTALVFAGVYFVNLAGVRREKIKKDRT